MDERGGFEGRETSEYQTRLGGISAAGIVQLIRKKQTRINAEHAQLAELVVELRRAPSMVARESGSASVTTLGRDDLVQSELQSALRIGWQRARKLVMTARALDERLFATMARLRAGVIDWERVQVIAKHATGLGDHTVRQAFKEGLSPRQAEERARAVLRQLEELVLDEAPLLSPGPDCGLEKKLAEAVATLAPAYVESLREESVKRRTVHPPAPVSKEPCDRDLRSVWAELPATEAHAVWNTIDAYARHLRHLGDERTLEELRADMLVHLVLRGHPPVTAPDGGVIDWSAVAGFDRFGLRANVEITVPFETLLGVSDAPGQLAGHGPVTAQVARAIAFSAGGVWRRLVTDAQGQVVDYGRTRYEPGEPLKEFVRGRDRTCRSPWCDRPAAACDADHVVPYPAGPTSAPNLQSKCRRCHRLKHEGGWRHQVLDTAVPGHAAGTIRMISPAGVEYFSAPPSVRPIRPPVFAGRTTDTTQEADHGEPTF